MLSMGENLAKEKRHRRFQNLPIGRPRRPPTTMEKTELVSGRLLHWGSRGAEIRSVTTLLTGVGGCCLFEIPHLAS